MNEHTKRPRQPQSERILLESEPVASATECTGLLAFLPGSEEETDALGDIYDIPLPLQSVNSDEEEC